MVPAFYRVQRCAGAAGFGDNGGGGFGADEGFRAVPDLTESEGIHRVREAVDSILVKRGEDRWLTRRICERGLLARSRRAARRGRRRRCSTLSPPRR